MPWQEVSLMSQRREFVRLAELDGSNRRELCRRFGISPKTGYKWLAREELTDRSRRPLHSPARTAARLEQRIVELRHAHPAWGARKLRRRLQVVGLAMPAASTVHAILRRYGLIDLARAGEHRAFQRFEHTRPNALWQMDFKGHFGLEHGGRCHPLTVLDDHSRFCVRLEACRNQHTATVRGHLEQAFRRYGLPERIGVDNGSPWGDDGDSHDTRLTVWLLRLGVRVSHSRPFHPQTLGKDERFHRTLKAEVLAGASFATMRAVQLRFDHWREIYNCERPHQALGYAPPISRYRPSPRSYPEPLPPIEYGPDDEVRHPDDGGWFSFKGRCCKVSKAFKGWPIALRRTLTDGCYQIYFCQQLIGELDLRLMET
jgi:transposase InsO family protein